MPAIDDIKKLPKDLQEKEEADARREGVAKFGAGLVGLFTTPWLGVATAGLGVIGYTTSFFVDEPRKSQYRSNSIKAMLGGVALSFPFTSFVVMGEGIVNAISGRRDGPFAPIANLSRFASRHLTAYPNDYPQTEVEMLLVSGQQSSEQQDLLRKHSRSTSIGNEDKQKRNTAQILPQNAAASLQPPPAIEASLDLSKVETHVEAQAKYNESSKNSFKRVGEPKVENGITTTVFDHPDHPGEQEFQITYKEKDGKLLEVIAGGKASCKLPPIPKENGTGFIQVVIHNGEKAISHDKGTGNIVDIVKAKTVVAKPIAPVQHVNPSDPKAPQGAIIAVNGKPVDTAVQRR